MVRVNRHNLHRIITPRPPFASEALKAQSAELLSLRALHPERVLFSVARSAFEACVPTPNLCDLQEPGPDRARIVCISDTHNDNASIPSLPPGDVLIHAGDLTQNGSECELRSALACLDAAPHPHKVFIAGNHDWELANPTVRDALLDSFPSLTYLEDTSVVLEVRGRLLSIYGSPRTPRRGAGVFQYHPGSGWDDARWEIPPHTDVVVTHGPLAYHLSGRRDALSVSRAGCEALLRALRVVQPRLHVFGHVHGGRGVARLRWCPVQAAYEGVCAGELGWPTVLWMLGCAAHARVVGPRKFQEELHTTLVNASWYGAQQGAIVVDIPLPDRLV